VEGSVKRSRSLIILAASAAPRCRRAAALRPSRAEDSTARSAPHQLLGHGKGERSRSTPSALYRRCSSTLSSRNSNRGWTRRLRCRLRSAGHASGERPQGEARLAYTTQARKGDQAVPSDHSGELGQLSLTPDEHAPSYGRAIDGPTQPGTAVARSPARVGGHEERWTRQRRPGMVARRVEPAPPVTVSHGRPSRAHGGVARAVGAGECPCSLQAPPRLVGLVLTAARTGAAPAGNNPLKWIDVHSKGAWPL
jgi:hypothetical protein